MLADWCPTPARGGPRPPERQIGDEKDVLEGMRFGSVDAGIITNAVVANVEPADVSGLKYRVMQNPFYIDMFLVAGRQRSHTCSVIELLVFQAQLRQAARRPRVRGARGRQGGDRAAAQGERRQCADAAG